MNSETVNRCSKATEWLQEFFATDNSPLDEVRREAGWRTFIGNLSRKRLLCCASIRSTTRWSLPNHTRGDA